MRRATTAAVALATGSALSITLLAGALGAAQATTGATDRSSTSSKPRYVDFALKGAGFGSRASGGDVPTGSGQTAYMAIGCTTRAGLDRENHEAEVTIPGLGRASAVRTDVWTRLKDGAVSTYTQNTVGKVVVAQSGFGSVAIRAISSLAHAWHDDKGFHSEATTSVGSIVYTPAVGDPQELDLPAPGQPIEIPGLATLSVGTTKKHVNDDGAFAQASALVVSKTASGSHSSVSQAKARVLNGVKHGTFHGFSAATEAEAADGNVTSGRTPLSLMPCQGTDGETRTKTASDSDLGGNLVVTGLKTAMLGKQLPRKSVAFQQGSVAHFDLGGGQLHIDGIIGRANVTRGGGELVADTKGSTVGTVTANGEEQEFPDTGVLEIPGVAKLERFVTKKSRNGISIIALRVTLLDGTGAVLNLGQAKMQIRPH
jgi:hypothetical protein